MSRLGDRLLDWSGARLGVPELGDSVRELHARRVESHGTSAARRWYGRQVGAAVARAAVASVPGRGTAALAASEVRRAGRRFVRTPLHALSFAAVVGVGITTATFMVLTRSDMMALDSGLPVDTRVVVWLDSEERPNPLMSLSGREAWLTSSPPAAASIVAIWPARHVVETPAGALQVGGERVLPGYLERLGGTLARGRDLDGPDELVLSHAFWTARFAADPAVVGRTLTVSGRTVGVVGVAAPGFRGPLCCVPPDFWITAGDSPEPSPARIVVVDPRDPSAAEDWLTRSVTSPEAPVRAALDHPTAHPFGGPDGPVARVLGVLVVLALVVWFSTLASGANLVLSDALARRPETRVRRALGARRIHTVVHALADVGWLALLAAGFGVAATAALTRIVPWLLPIVGRGSSIQVRVGSDGWTVAAVAGAVSAVVCAMPAVVAALRVGSAGPLLDRGPASGRFAAAGLALQVTLAVALVIVTGQFVSTIRGLDGDFVGFRRGDVAVHFVRPADSVAAGADAEAVVARVAAGRPGSAALTARLPVYGAALDSVALPDGRRVEAAVERVTPGFFDLVGTRLLAGEPARAAGDVVASRDLGVEVGAILTVGDSSALRVVGVVESATWGTGAVRPTVYLGWGSEPVGSAVLLVDPRGAGGSIGALLPALTGVGLALQPFETLDGLLVRSRVLSVFLTRLAGAFGLVALLVALGGVHAHFLRWIRAAERNLAIRRALGAPLPRLGGTVVGAAVRSVASGAVVGGALGFLAGRLTESFLAGVSPVTPGWALAGAVGVAGVSLLALAGPLARLRRVAPLRLLRPG